MMTIDKSPTGVGGFLGGRSERGEYWLSVLGLFAFNLVLNFTVGDPLLTSFISLPIWLVIAARRLHDFDRRGWWGLIPFALGFVLGFIGAFVAIPPLLTMMINSGAMLTTVLVIGFTPGTAGPNRFGESVELPDPT